jgi:uncharacterized protein YmfQ (DUF2313 family)
MSNDFGKNITKEEQTQSLADYLPNGFLFAGKNISSKKLRKLLFGLAQELYREQQKVVEVEEQYFLPQTTELIEEWESAYGIPSECFTNVVSLSQRINQVLAKIRANGVQTEKDFIDLAKFMGFDITITHGTDEAIFPLPFPWAFTPSGKTARFTFFINFDKSELKHTFPLEFPFLFTPGATSVIECFFLKLKPANVQLLFRYIN